MRNSAAWSTITFWKARLFVLFLTYGLDSKHWARIGVFLEAMEWCMSTSKRWHLEYW